MSAARIIESMGASVSLVDGKLKLSGLDRLDRDTAARVLEVARARKAEIVEELREGSASVPADATPLAALARFERDPRGVVAWLAAQPAGQERTPEVRRRLQECIRAEARLRVREAGE